MTALTTAGPTAVAALAAEEALAEAAPELVPGFRASLPRATDVVARRLTGAAFRERPRLVSWAGDRGSFPSVGGGYLVATAARYGFDRVEVTERTELDPAQLLAQLADRGDDVGSVARELTDATVNLALAYARRVRLDEELVEEARLTGAVDTLDLVRGLDADAACAYFERLATEGHNLHPCGRTRLGWGVPDVLAHDLESPATSVGFVAVRRDVHIGDDIARDMVPGLTLDPARFAVTPVHGWQLDRVVRRRYADLVADGLLVPLAHTLPATPTAALRTLLLPPVAGDRRYLKLSLDIQVTSTRRTISVASTRNGPAVSRVLASALEAFGDRVLLMAETAGSATVASGGRERDLAAIVRCGLSGRLRPGELPVPGGALYAVSPVTGSTLVAELTCRFGRSQGLSRRPDAALQFLDAYARMLLPPVLTLATRHGIGLEAHLQNCIPTFVDGVPHRLAVRDLAGMRLYPPRLSAALDLWPASVIVTDDADVMRAKVAYTALQAHLGEIVVRLVDSHDLDERAAWSAVRRVLDEVYDGLRADPATSERAAEDHAFMTAPTLPHKALLGMRLAGGSSDIYVRVGNPLR